jgi:carboxylate-amine ligase
MTVERMLPAWARWKGGEPWTVGLEEEVMLLERDGSPAWRSEDVLELLDERHARGETHGLALEIATDPHPTVGAAASQLRHLRAAVADAAGSFGLSAAVAGTHPLARSEDVEVSPGARYQYLHATMRELARARAHVRAARACRRPHARARHPRVRRHAPLHPGAARAVGELAVHARRRLGWRRRAPVFQAFRAPACRARSAPTTPTSRRSTCLLRCGAIPEPTFIWWTCGCSRGSARSSCA